MGILQSIRGQGEHAGCLVQDAVYKVSAKVQVHWPDPTPAEIVAGSTQPDGSTHWSTLILCPDSSFMKTRVLFLVNGR